MSDDKLIGHAPCPVCKGPAARVTFSKKSRALLTCNQGKCRVQLFTRSDESDEGLRAMVTAPAPKPEPAPKAEPAPEAEPAPATATATAAVPRRSSWEMY